MLRCRVQGFHLQDLRSACRVRLRSLGAVLVGGLSVAVFTRDSKKSSSTSVRVPLVWSSRRRGPNKARPEIKFLLILLSCKQDQIYLVHSQRGKNKYVADSLQTASELCNWKKKQKKPAQKKQKLAFSKQHPLRNSSDRKRCRIN